MVTTKIRCGVTPNQELCLLKDLVRYRKEENHGFNKLSILQKNLEYDAFNYD